jgi:hypothetical protein
MDRGWRRGPRLVGSRYARGTLAFSNPAIKALKRPQRNTPAATIITPAGAKQHEQRLRTVGA